MTIKELNVQDLFKIRDAIKTLIMYLDIDILRELQKQITERLDELREN